VKDATSAVANVDDYSGSARLLAATTLRNVLGTRNLGDILSERESIAQEMQVYKMSSFFNIIVSSWGA
jgi:erythrocyte band 7 integral membrane protein